MTNMQPDDIIKNDSEVLGVYLEPTDQVDEIDKEERSKIATALPILDELIEWFDLAIASCDSINNLDVKSEEALTMQVKRNMMVKDLLKQKRSQLLSRFWNFKQNQPEDEDE